MGVVSSVEKLNDQIINCPIDFSCDKTIEDEEPLKYNRQMNTEIYTKRFIHNQNKLYPQESTGVNKSNEDIVASSDLKISSKGILKSPNSNPQSSKSDKKVTFNRSQIKEEKFFRSNKKHKVTLKDLEKLF